MVKAIKYMHTNTNKQSGVASIFVVVFFMLLISIIVLGFAQIVSQDQRQSTNADLSASAYDSSQAGVEDAKRALAQYKKECIETNQQTSTGCVDKYTGPDGAFSGNGCTVFQEKLGGSGDLKLDIDSGSKEVSVTTDTADQSLEQAYTCLKVAWRTNDYKRTLDNGSSIFVPLKTVSDYPDQLRISWFDKSEAAKIELPSLVSNFRLPTNNSTEKWDIQTTPTESKTPPVLRVQIISVPKGNFSIDEIDRGAKTVFLYPSSVGGSSVDVTFSDLDRRQPKTGPVPIRCNSGSSSFICSASLTNFAPGPPDQYDYYLRIMPIYNGAKLQIQMFDSGNNRLQFDGVSPEIDSTGRANDVFRRIISRIAFDTDSTGIDISQGVCKNFRLADGNEYYSFDCAGRNDLVQE